jgi:hypothetical protein
MGKGMENTTAGTDYGTGGTYEVPPNTNPDNVGNTWTNPDEYARALTRNMVVPLLAQDGRMRSRPIPIPIMWARLCPLPMI